MQVRNIGPVWSGSRKCRLTDELQETQDPRDPVMPIEKFGLDDCLDARDVTGLDDEAIV